MLQTFKKLSLHFYHETENPLIDHLNTSQHELSGLQKLKLKSAHVTLDKVMKLLMSSRPSLRTLWLHQLYVE